MERIAQNRLLLVDMAIATGIRYTHRQVPALSKPPWNGILVINRRWLRMLLLLINADY